MRLLLDTCTFLWIAEGSAQVLPVCRELFDDVENDLFLSSISVWEIAAKNSIGRLPLPETVRKFVRNYRERLQISPLPFDEESVFQHHQLPRLHRDPFDRMLICQAIAHGLAILTPDTNISQYLVRTIW